MLKTKYVALFAGTIILLLVISSCKRDKHRVNVKDVQVNLHIDRFEQDFFKLNMGNAPEVLPQLEKKYPEFYPSFVQDIMEFGNPADTSAIQRLLMFATYPDMRLLYKQANSIYHDFSAQQAELEQMFKYFRFHFPDRQVPHIYTFVAPFYFATPYYDTSIAIGLDMFLGADNPLYKNTNFPAYVVRRLNKEYMTPMVTKALANQQFALGTSDKTMLDQIITQGKVLYFMDAMLPATSDTLKIGYTKQQLEWCKDNEVEIWKHLVDKKMLYSTDYKSFRAYMDEAPFTSASDVPPDASPRFAVWVGWQIVKKYMDANQNVTLAQLMADQDAAGILRKSAYKPGK